MAIVRDNTCSPVSRSGVLASQPTFINSRTHSSTFRGPDNIPLLSSSLKLSPSMSKIPSLTPMTTQGCPSDCFSLSECINGVAFYKFECVDNEYVRQDNPWKVYDLSAKLMTLLIKSIF